MSHFNLDFVVEITKKVKKYVRFGTNLSIVGARTLSQDQAILNVIKPNIQTSSFLSLLRKISLIRKER